METVTQNTSGSSWAQAFDDAECPVCLGDRIVEEPVFGRFAVEASRPIYCPRCSTGKPVRSRS